MRIIKVREQAGLTKHEFALAIGVSKSKYYRFEEGDPSAELPASAVAVLMSRFRVHPNWLFFGEGGDGPVYLDELVARSELEREKQKSIDLAEENRQLYKKLFEQEQVRTERLKGS